MSLINKIASLTVIAVVFIIWGLYINLFPGNESTQAGYLTDTYGFIALIAAIYGYIVSRSWGANNSLVGKSLLYLSAGLLMQFLGNLSYTLIYYLTNIENPYPSFGEVFYVASVPLYIIGIWNLAKSSGVKFTLETSMGKLYSVLIVAIGLAGSYVIFVSGQIQSNEPLLNRILDVYYPLGQALFVALAVCTYILSTNLLGGIMRTRVIFILFALTFQYFADAVFLYQTRQDSWQPAGVSDLLFIVSYFLMGLGLILYESAALKISRRTP